jgi:hypothetical protein
VGESVADIAHVPQHDIAANDSAERACKRRHEHTVAEELELERLEEVDCHEA